MTRKEILEQLKSLSTVERLSIIEAALRFVHEDLQSTESDAAKSKQLTEAAKTLLPDYTSDLTAFAAIDADEFHAEKLERVYTAISKPILS